MLSLFLPETAHDGLSASVQSSIIEPAFELAHGMHLSVNKFSMHWTPGHNDPSRYHQPIPQNASLDFVTVEGPSVKMSQPTGNGKVVKYMFDLTPELRFEFAKVDGFAPSKVLKPGRVVVDATGDAPGSQGRHSTLLGWMDEQVRSQPHKRSLSIKRKVVEKVSEFLRPPNF
jgi:hypothetical protein